MLPIVRKNKKKKKSVGGSRRRAFVAIRVAIRRGGRLEIFFFGSEKDRWCATLKMAG